MSFVTPLVDYALASAVTPPDISTAHPQHNLHISALRIQAAQDVGHSVH
jgi:hypothetical protein